MAGDASRRLAVFAIVTCVFAIGGRTPGAQQTSDPIVGVLDGYAEGRYDDALARLRTLGSARVIRDRLRDQGQRWIASADPARRERRLEIAAIVALEAAHIGFAAAGQPGVPYGTKNLQQLFDTRQLLEVGCAWVRQGTASEFERVWLLASVALQQSVQNHYRVYTEIRFSDNRTVNPEVPFRDVMPQYSLWMQNADLQEWDLAHWGHATSRFPDEPRFALAKILARPEVRRLPNRPGTAAMFMTQGFGSSEFDRLPELEKLAASVVRQTFVDLGRFLDRPGVSAEANLRRGILQFHQARLVDSLDSLRAATKEADRDIAYLAHLYAGLALDGLNRRSEAVDAFEAALRVVPDARSAVVALAADLFQLDRRAEASARLAAAFARPAPDDPWRRFSLGDYRFWPDYLNRLREAARS
jgi:hypothetical protein